MKRKFGASLFLLAGLLVPLCLATAGIGMAQGPFKAEIPFAVTSSGQSLDAETVSIVCKRAKLAHAFDNILKPEALKGLKSLVVAMGGSAKGLGEAGIDEKGELKRVNALLTRARKQKIKVIAVHVGGEARTGALSDKFIEPVVAGADFLLVTEDSDRSGVFTAMAKEKKIPLQVVKKTADVGNALKAVFAVK